MEPSTVFSLATYLALPGWLILVFLPKFPVLRDVVAGLAIPLALSVCYAVVFASRVGSAPEGGGFGSLAEVAVLFSDEWLLLVGWVHYLAFDLFVGAWEVRDSRRHGIPHLLVIPCLALTLMAGPAGLAIYLLIRGAWKRKWSAQEAPTADGLSPT